MSEIILHRVKTTTNYGVFEDQSGTGASVGKHYFANELLEEAGVEDILIITLSAPQKPARATRARAPKATTAVKTVTASKPAAKATPRKRVTSKTA